MLRDLPKLDYLDLSNQKLIEINEIMNLNDLIILDLGCGDGETINYFNKNLLVIQFFV